MDIVLAIAATICAIGAGAAVVVAVILSVVANQIKKIEKVKHVIQ